MPPAPSLNRVIDRRTFLSRAAVASSFVAMPGAFADALVRTPRQTEGPFYPDHLPLDTDNDLIGRVRP